MKKLFVVVMLLLASMTLVWSDAQAKRLGGGSSIGKQSSNYTRQVPGSPSIAPAAPAATPLPAPAPARPASPWRGVLGGALLGLGLGALLSHFGLGGAAAGLISTVLLIAVAGFVVMLLMRLLSGKGRAGAYPPYAEEPRPAYVNTSAPSVYTPEIGSRIEPVGMQAPAALPGNGAAHATIVPWGIPADFDVAGFVRNGKAYFIRLQAAWDRADINDIREFTTPEMFGELRLQLQERGSSPNNTDVVQIDAELLGIETVGEHYLATLRFTGLIKEAPDVSAEPFAEIWNLSKPISGPGGWVLAGIQQV